MKRLNENNRYWQITGQLEEKKGFLLRKNVVKTIFNSLTVIYGWPPGQFVYLEDAQSHWRSKICGNSYKAREKKTTKKFALIYLKANSHVKPLTFICQQGD